MSLSSRDCYVLNQGKIVGFDTQLKDDEIYTVCPRLRGGKGGFGSMLRAIGAQIEKTTNREACRDLSGRRMRDVNNEKKMVEYIEKKAEEERERAKKKAEKLERLTQNPKHFFNDPDYDNKVHETVANVDKAVEKGILAHSKKRKMKEKETPEPKIKRGLWLEEEDISSEDSDSDTDISQIVSKSDTCIQPNDGASTSKAAEECVRSNKPEELKSSENECDKDKEDTDAVKNLDDGTMPKSDNLS